MFRLDKYIKKITCLLFIVIMCASSCGEYEVLEHNKQVRRSVDSLYRLKRDSLIKFSDSLCKLNHEDFIQTAYDSILDIRIKEIEKLLED